MNPFEMVLGIVLIGSIASVLRVKYGVRRDKWGNEHPIDDGENRRLNEEVRTLKERIAVLERIATDRGTALEHEIERLRDR